MAFKFIESAQQRWRAMNAPQLVALVRGRRHIHQRQARRTTRRARSTKRSPENGVKTRRSTGLDYSSRNWRPWRLLRFWRSIRPMGVVSRRPGATDGFAELILVDWFGGGGG